MGALMITCPNTGQPISTGIETDEYSLLQIADVPARTRCPLCGLDHIWWKREAWLANRPLSQWLFSGHKRAVPALPTRAITGCRCSISRDPSLAKEGERVPHAKPSAP